VALDELADWLNVYWPKVDWPKVDWLNEESHSSACRRDVAVKDTHKMNLLTIKSGMRIASAVTMRQDGAGRELRRGDERFRCGWYAVAHRF